VVSIANCPAKRPVQLEGANQKGVVVCHKKGGTGKKNDNFNKKRNGLLVEHLFKQKWPRKLGIQEKNTHTEGEGNSHESGASQAHLMERRTKRKNNRKIGLHTRNTGKNRK